MKEDMPDDWAKWLILTMGSGRSFGSMLKWMTVGAILSMILMTLAVLSHS